LGELSDGQAFAAAGLLLRDVLVRVGLGHCRRFFG
jgi:hypothetical protein